MTGRWNVVVADFSARLSHVFWRLYCLWKGCGPVEDGCGVKGDRGVDGYGVIHGGGGHIRLVCMCVLWGWDGMGVGRRGKEPSHNKITKDHGLCYYDDSHICRSCFSSLIFVSLPFFS